jgi:ribosome-interacting GTPase 1
LVRNFCNQIHNTLAKTLKYAQVVGLCAALNDAHWSALYV